ncbi:type II toxin-antitoxin system YafQ family toxin [Enterococcus silesiacus]|nr:type II toxin-antitoxin system YafQ family toxin [Enterococcus silesiacus]
MKIKTVPTFERNYKALKKKQYDMDKFEVVPGLLLSQDTE